MVYALSKSCETNVNKPQPEAILTPWRRKKNVGPGQMRTVFLLIIFFLENMQPARQK